MGGQRFQVPNVHEPRGYSHVVRAGKTIYVSGQVGVAPNGELPGDGGFRAQAEQVCENLQRVLATAGASLRDIVKITTFLVDRETMPIWREVRSRYLGPEPPASTAVIVAGLIDPRWLIEVEAIAVVD
jgi:enamine deaminase RidA (YjgF/YER057c/UK114 family)